MRPRRVILRNAALVGVTLAAFADCASIQQATRMAVNPRFLVFEVTLAGHSELRRMSLRSLDNGVMTIVQNARSPDWSAELNQIAYVDHPSGHLFLADPNGEHPMQLTDDSEFADDWPAISPDGTSVAFSRHRRVGPFNEELWLLDIATKTARQLTHPPERERHRFPSWSPEGTKLVFEAELTSKWTHLVQGGYELPNSDLKIVDVATGEVTWLTRTPFSEYYPRWSPKGDGILYEAYAGGLESHELWTSLHTIKVDGTGAEPIMYNWPSGMYARGGVGPVRGGDACWADYGNAVIFLKETTGAREIVLLSLGDPPSMETFVSVDGISYPSWVGLTPGQSLTLKL